MKDIMIRCPKCGWEPRKHDLWVCDDDCGCEWNTFDTGRKCPDCGKLWQDTQCRRCGKWSPHLDWYEGLDDAVEELAKEEVKKCTENH